MLLKELSDKELAELYNDNKWLMEQIDNQAWERASFDQAEEFKLIGAECFDYHDHYTSFYLTTPTIYGAKAPEKVAGKLDTEYLSEEDTKLYNEMCELIDKWENMTTDEQDEHEDVYDKASELCDKLADNLTTYFRDFEGMEYFIEQKDYVLEDIKNGDNWLSDLEIVDGKFNEETNSFEKVIKQVVYHG